MWINIDQSVCGAADTVVLYLRLITAAEVCCM